MCCWPAYAAQSSSCIWRGLRPAGIKPVYVFEGKPPELKIEQLKQRREKRDEADKELAAAKEAGDQEAIEKYSKRTTKVGTAVGVLAGSNVHACASSTRGPAAMRAESLKEDSHSCIKQRGPWAH